MLIKKFIFTLITLPVLNPILRVLYKYKARLSTGKRFFPFSGTLRWDVRPDTQLMMCSDGADTIVTHLHWTGEFEPEVVSVWLDYLTPQSIVLDIGANTGFYSILSGLIATQGQVFSFEPAPRLLKYLNTNIHKNQLLERVNICTDVISNFVGKTEFFMVDSVTLPVGSSQNKEFRAENYPTKTYELSTNTIDNYLEEFDLNHLDLVKIDTESTEHLVCQGMLKTLTAFRPKIVCEILYDEVASVIQSILEPLNYEYFLITPDGLKPTENICFDPNSYNHFFLPRHSSGE